MTTDTLYATEIEPPKPTAIQITQYDPIRSEIESLKAKNAALVFQYDTPEGNRNARSHVHVLRRKKGRVDQIRKAAKADALEYGRRVDAIAKQLTSELDAMIDVHQKPLDEIEQREREAREAEERRIAAERAEAERAAEAERQRVLAAEREARLQAQRELAAIRQEQERERIERAAAERARVEAEQRAARERERIESERRAAEEARLQAERDRIDAERRAIEAERRAIEEARIAEENARREQEEAVERAKTAERERIEADQRALREAKLAEERAEQERRQQAEVRAQIVGTLKARLREIAPTISLKDASRVAEAILDEAIDGVRYVGNQ